MKIAQGKFDLTHMRNAEPKTIYYRSQYNNRSSNNGDIDPQQTYWLFCITDFDWKGCKNVYIPEGGGAGL